MDDYEDAQKARTGASTIFGGPQRLVNTAPRPKNMGRGPFMTEKKKMNLDFIRYRVSQLTIKLIHLVIKKSQTIIKL